MATEAKVPIKEKHLKRIEKKKRKIQAYLELITDSRRKASNGGVVESCPEPEDVDIEDIIYDRDIKDKDLLVLRRKVKRELLKVKPRIILKEDGLKAKVSTFNDVGEVVTTDEPIVPITFLEAQIFLVSCLLPSPKRLHQPLCAEIQRVTRAAQVDIFLLEDSSWFKLSPEERLYFQNVIKFDVLDQAKTCALEHDLWTRKMLEIPISYSELVQMDTKESESATNSDSETVIVATKTNLMLSREQMFDEGFPMMPSNDTNGTSQELETVSGSKSDSEGKSEPKTDGKSEPNADGKDEPPPKWCKKIKPTLKCYQEPTNDSPLFSIDCEMCLTTASILEVTRVSLINEQEEVVYETLVKPYNEITNHLTEYSGVTAEMLESVTTKLKHVRRSLRSILPPDSILVGHSLNNDLSCLGLYHPFVIDTSVIYNLTGIRHHKSKLKVLSQLFLNQKIQEDRTKVEGEQGDHGKKSGHDSVEDAKAALRLVKLKLGHDLNFGDCVKSKRRITWCKKGVVHVPIVEFFKSKNECINLLYNSIDTLNQLPVHGLDESRNNRRIFVFTNSNFSLPQSKMKAQIFKSLSRNRAITVVFTSIGLCYISCH